MIHNSPFDLIEVQYNENKLIIEGDVIKLKPREMDYFMVLYNQKGRVISDDSLLNGVYGKDPSSIKAAHVTVHHINKKLNTYGISIIRVYGRGYKLGLLKDKDTRLADQIVEIDGHKKTVREWASFYGLKLGLIYSRHSNGTSLNKCFYDNKNPLRKTS